MNIKTKGGTCSSRNLRRSKYQEYGGSQPPGTFQPKKWKLFSQKCTKMHQTYLIAQKCLKRCLIPKTLLKNSLHLGNWWNLIVEFSAAGAQQGGYLRCTVSLKTIIFALYCSQFSKIVCREFLVVVVSANFLEGDRVEVAPSGSYGVYTVYTPQKLLAPSIFFWYRPRWSGADFHLCTWSTKMKFVGSSIPGVSKNTGGHVGFLPKRHFLEHFGTYQQHCVTNSWKYVNGSLIQFAHCYCGATTNDVDN